MNNIEYMKRKVEELLIDSNRLVVTSPGNVVDELHSAANCLVQAISHYEKACKKATGHECD